MYFYNHCVLKILEKPPMYTNPELDMIQKDIDELVKERLILETEIAQKEADLKIRSGEVKSLQVKKFENNTIK